MANSKRGQFLVKSEYAKHLRSNKTKVSVWKQENVRLKTFLKREKENGTIRFV